MVFLLLNFKYTQFAVRVWIQDGFYSDPRGLNAGGGIGTAFFSNPNDLGVAITSIAGLSFYMIGSDAKKLFNWFKMRWFHIAMTASIPIAVLATSSRGAALGLGVVLLAWWYKSERKFLGFVLIGITAITFVVLIPDDNWVRFQIMSTEEDSSGQTRLDLWRAGIQMTNEYPLTGVGPNNFVYVNQTRHGSDLPFVQHNVFIQASSELGYPGLMLFVAMVIGCFYSQMKVRRILNEKGIEDPFLYGLSHGLDLSVVGFAVNGLFITVLYYPFFWMLLALSVSLSDVVRQLEPSSQNAVAATGSSQEAPLQTVGA
jgi:O-antigen ligase